MQTAMQTVGSMLPMTGGVRLWSSRRWVAQRPASSRPLCAAGSPRLGAPFTTSSSSSRSVALGARTSLALHRRSPLGRPVAAAASAAAAGGGAYPEQQPPPHPPPQQLSPEEAAFAAAAAARNTPLARLWRWIQRAIALAVCMVMAALGAASPATAAAARAQSGQPVGVPYAEAADLGGVPAVRAGAWDTGIMLAADEPAGRYSTPEELSRNTRLAMSKTLDEKSLRRYRRVAASRPSKGGKKVDATKSAVFDPNAVPSQEELEAIGIQTAWRPDKLKDLTYTQFVTLVKEGRVDKVKYTDDHRSVFVTTKASAPGGARTEKVALPFDPDLFDTMVDHGVFIESPDRNPVLPMLHSLARLLFPLSLCSLLIKGSFSLGRKQKRDAIFGGAKLQSMQSGEGRVTFKDIAGIDQVQSEIMEIVEFLRNPQRFLTLGAKSPAGVLLVGPPGTGKTLLAKAIAGEAGVPFFSVAGTEFMEMFVGVGAARVRDMFAQARKNAPCILFIDEFDGLGKARSYGGSGNDESVHTINQLLTEMDGFEDNTGVVIMAATNRPAALDQALTRPGRFDRIVHLPLPNTEGRIGILKVHARGKRVSPDLDYSKVARATAGFTGAQLMNLMNQAAIVAVRQRQPLITDTVVFEALEKIHRDQLGRSGGTGTAIDEDSGSIPIRMRKTIAVYEAARALIGYITPDYDEIQRVSVCPQGLATGYTYFLPKEEMLESRIVTRGYMESRMVVALAGRCAEKLVLGEAQVSTSGAKDLQQANIIAREMVYRCGFSRRLGPVSLMDNEEVYINKLDSSVVADISTELAKVAYADIEELVEAAEAKAYYGLATNYTALEALVGVLMERDNVTGEELADVLEGAGVKRFAASELLGYGWGEDGGLVYPGKPETSPERRELALATGPSPDGPAGSNGNGSEGAPWWMSDKNPYRVRTDVPNFLDLR